jgi:hypothetical protein
MPVYSDEESNSDCSDTEQPSTTQVLSESDEAPEHNEKPKKKVMTSVDLLEEFSNVFTKLQTLNSDFYEKEKAFDKDRKEYQTERKRLEREQESLFKRLGKTVVSETTKKKKRTGNSTGGFNKVVPVPKALRKYLDIDDTDLSRSAVNKLLHAKFKAEGFKEGKTTTISSKKTAKALGVSKDHVIEFSEFSKFLAGFYNAEKVSAN